MKSFGERRVDQQETSPEQSKDYEESLLSAQCLPQHGGMAFLHSVVPQSLLTEQTSTLRESQSRSSHLLVPATQN